MTISNKSWNGEEAGQCAVDDAVDAVAATDRRGEGGGNNSSLFKGFV